MLPARRSSRRGRRDRASRSARPGELRVGLLRPGSRTSSTPVSSPDPAHVPDRLVRAPAGPRGRREAPGRHGPRARPGRSSSITSSTASAAAHATGFPPKVENHSVVSASRSVISRRVISAATGWPLPIGLPSVTRSAATPAPRTTTGARRCGRGRPAPRRRRRARRRRASDPRAHARPRRAAQDPVGREAAVDEGPAGRHRRARWSRSAARESSSAASSGIRVVA